VLGRISIVVRRARPQGKRRPKNPSLFLAVNDFRECVGELRVAFSSRLGGGFGAFLVANLVLFGGGFWCCVVADLVLWWLILVVWVADLVLWWLILVLWWLILVLCVADFSWIRGFLFMTSRFRRRISVYFVEIVCRRTVSEWGSS
jgi:hypothetical protein